MSGQDTKLCKATTDCAKYEDGDACNGTLFCNKALGVCQMNPATVVYCPTVNDTACAANQCQPATGQCAMMPKPDQTPCSDGNLCTTGEACQSGICKASQGADTCGCKADADCAKYEDGDACNGKLFCNLAQAKCELNPATVVVCPTGLDAVCGKNVCDKATGACALAFASTATLCDADGSPCTPYDHCEAGKCKADVSLCQCQVAGDCAAWEDGDLCNGNLYCDVAAKKCAVNPASVPAPCAQTGTGACSVQACVAATGKCAAVASFEGGPCSDGDACTAGEKCAAGVCGTGQGVVCDDNQPCTDDTCDKAKGCVTLANAGTCTDGNLCTAGDKCAGGVCLAGAASACDDQNVCTSDVCDKSMGCMHNPLPGEGACDDGDPCTIGEKCLFPLGKCGGGAAKSCDDGKVCTKDSCVAGIGCEYLPVAGSCSDGDACTVGDACGGGACLPGSATKCDDGNVCTDDSCDKAKGCVQLANAASCTDGNACTEGDACAGGKCVSGKAKVCSVGVCEPKDGSCPAGCGDGYLAIPIDDAGVKKVVCAPEVPVWGQYAAHVTGLTTLSNGTVFHNLTGLIWQATGAPAKTYAWFDAAAYCDALTLGGMNDWRLPTRTEILSIASRQKKSAPLAPVEIVGITTSQLWLASAHAPVPDSHLTYDSLSGDVRWRKDGEPHKPICVRGTAPQKLVADRFVPQLGLLAVFDSWTELAWEKNQTCCKNYDQALLYCAELAAVEEPGWRVPSFEELEALFGRPKPGLSALDPSIFPSGNAQFNQSTSESGTGFGNYGLHNDSGLTEAHSKTWEYAVRCVRDCGDASQCTTDKMDPKTGTCTHTPLPDTATCTDNNACTLNDTCKAGKCTSTTTGDCNDANACTTDVCDAKTGCKNTAVTDDTPCGAGQICKAGACKFGCAGTGACDDLNACTTGDTCANGGCSGNALTCDDKNVCTTDTCDKASGCKFTPVSDNATCDDGKLCTTADGCKSGTCTGAVVTCNDNSKCTSDSCDPGTGKCINTNLCDDFNLCTMDNCSPSTGCTYQNANNGGSCGGTKTCQAGKCIALGGCTDKDVWQTTFGLMGTDEVHAMVPFFDNTTYLVGLTSSKGKGDDDVWLQRISALGSPVSDWTFGTTASDSAEAATVTTQISVIWMAGSTFGGGKGKDDGYVIRRAPDLTHKEFVLGGAESDAFKAVATSPDGGVWLAGASSSAGGNGGTDAWLVRMAVDGTVVWEKRLGGAKDDEARGVVVLKDGGAFVVGKTLSFGAGKNDGRVWRVDATGKVLWDYPFGSSEDDWFNAVCPDGKGGVVAVGTSWKNGVANGDGWAMGLTDDGDFSWNAPERFYGGAKGEALLACGVGQLGQTLLAGHQTGAGGLLEGWLMAVDGSGVQQWQKGYAGGDGTAARAVAQVGVQVQVAGTREESVPGTQGWLGKVDGWGNAICAESGGCFAMSLAVCGDGDSCTTDLCSSATACQHGVSDTSACLDASPCTAAGVCKGVSCQLHERLWGAKPYHEVQASFDTVFVKKSGGIIAFQDKGKMLVHGSGGELILERPTPAGGSQIGCANQFGSIAIAGGGKRTRFSPSMSTMWTDAGAWQGCALSDEGVTYAVPDDAGSVLVSLGATGVQTWSGGTGFGQLSSRAAMGLTSNRVYSWFSTSTVGKLSVHSLAGELVASNSTTGRPGGSGAILWTNTGVIASKCENAVFLFGSVGSTQYNGTPWVGKLDSAGDSKWELAVKPDHGCNGGKGACSFIGGAASADCGFVGIAASVGPVVGIIRFSSAGKLVDQRELGLWTAFIFSGPSVPTPDGGFFFTFGISNTPGVFSARVDSWGNKSCGVGNCQSLTWEDCDDLNACTTDSCSPTGGCVHPANSLPCPDDGVLCTDDLCAAGKCTHAWGSAPCTDNNPCTALDTCASGTCKSGTPAAQPTCAMTPILASNTTLGCNPATKTCPSSDASPAHAVTLSTYSLDTTEVTVAQYAACVSAGKCTQPSKVSSGCTYDNAVKTNHPINCLTHAQAAEYCAWTGGGGRLPTEAEWERAARGSDDRTYPWGNSPDPTCLHSTYGSLCGTGTKAVAINPSGKSQAGHFDLAGNVKEWTADWYSATAYTTDSQTDPKGPSTGTKRVVRGGGYTSNADALRTYAREAEDPSTTSPQIGFRCARSGN